MTWSSNHACTDYGDYTGHVNEVGTLSHTHAPTVTTEKLAQNLK